MKQDTFDTPTRKVENHDEEGALASLREELKQTQSKFEEWKAKAKVGVDHLRKRIVQLTTQLEDSESQRQALAASLDNLRSSKEGEGASTEGSRIPQKLGSPAALELEREVGESLSKGSKEKTEVLGEAPTYAKNGFPQVSKTANPSSTSEDELELYKQRVATTMKLQQKNSEALQNQVVELQERLRLAERELEERSKMLLGKGETVSLLEQRLSSVERAYEELRQKPEGLSCGPNMDRISAMEETMEERMSTLHAEFMHHENSLLIQHRNEIERLQSMHEQEIEAIRQEADERFTREIEAALSFHKQPSPLLPLETSPQNDAAYVELLREFEALEDQHRTLLKENTALKNKIQNLIARKDMVDDSKEVSNPYHQHNPTSLAEANKVIQSLQTSLATATDQFWQAKKALMSGKDNKSSEGALDPQQVAYLKSIIVNFFCLCNNNSTIEKLLPVTSTLLHFSEEDLDAIYKNKPDWKRKK